MLQFRVKIRYKPLLVRPSDNRSLSILSSPPITSLFAQKRVFASPSFPETYSLFQNEYSRTPFSPKDLFTLSQNTRVSPHPSPKASPRCSTLSADSAPFAMKIWPTTRRVILPRMTALPIFMFSGYSPAAGRTVSKRAGNHTPADPPSPLQSTPTKNRGGGGGPAKRFLIAGSHDESRASLLPNVPTFQRSNDQPSNVPTPRPRVLLRHPPQGAKMTPINNLHRETSAPRPVSNTSRADTGHAIRRLSFPVASRSQQHRDRTRKKAWVQRSIVDPSAGWSG